MLEKLSLRERVVVKGGAAAVALILVLHFGLLPWLEEAPEPGKAVEERELILQRYQRLTTMAGSEQTRLAAAQERLKNTEAGLLESPSASLASAEWQRLVRELADAKGVQLSSSEVLRTQELSPDYALVVGRVQFGCRLDQLVDFLAALGTSPKLVSVRRMRLLAMPSSARNRLTVDITLGAPMRTARSAAAAEP